VLRGLELEQLRRFPPPKPGRVPFGHELRVLGRYLSGGNALFDPSGLWRAYRALASARQRLLYRAFLSSEALPPSAWRELLGADELDAWQERRLLRIAGDGFRCRFRCCPIGRVLLLGDPDEPKLLRRVLIGQDSYNMVHFMDRQLLGRYGRYLDVGPGSGVVLLNYAARADEAVGIDINPRAVAISRLNAELNGIANCRVVEDDALARGQAFGRFDLVSWNTPFVFLPEECRDTHLDAFGGHLGLDLPLRFVRCLPGLLSEAGTCYLGMSAPILRSGENLLEKQLDELAAELGLDIVNHVIQTYWHAIYRDFHEAHGIDKNELVFLAITRGSGRVRRVDPPLTTRASDRVREVAYRALR
jgi:methylase of polypeptide subunit release factors